MSRSSLFRLDGEVAVVTGAYGRLGPIWLDALLDAGARVAALDLASALQSPAFGALVSRAGDRVLGCECDITDRSSILAARERVVETFGPPTVLVNNAGIDQPPDPGAPRCTVESLPVEEFRRVVDVNLAGTFQMTQVIGGSMAERGRGSVVNIASIYASVSPDQRFYSHLPGEPPFLKPPAYGASKAGVVNLTRYFATLWAAVGVRVNALTPGGVLGEQDEEFKRKYAERVPMCRMALPKDLQGPLIFLASEASSYVTGIELPVDGGFMAW